MAVKAPAVTSKWLPIFEDFVKDIKISSKEVMSEDEAGVPLVMWESQKRFMRELAWGLDRGIRTFYCLKSRQLGITTVSIAWDLFWLAMHPNLTMALVTESEHNRDKNRTLLKMYLKSLPPDYADFHIIKGGDNRQHMRFSNGSRIDFLVAGTKKKSTAWGEGEGYTAAHGTELASWGSEDGLKSFMEALAQTHPSRLTVFESTAKGFNLWSDLWKGARKGSFHEHAFFIGWWASETNKIEQSDARFPTYGRAPPNATEREKIEQVARLYDWKITSEQLAWMRWREDDEAKRGSDRQMLDQNQPWTEEDAWVQSGFSFFPTRQLTLSIKALEDAPASPVSEGGVAYKGYRYGVEGTFFDMRMFPETEDRSLVELRVWEEPVEGAHYVIGCDPAWGRNDHKDRSSVSVWRGFADKMVQVAEFASADVEVQHCAWILAHLAGAYGDCNVNYEVNGPGNVIKQQWDQIRGQLNADMYARFVREREWTDALSSARWYLFARPDSAGRPGAIGFSTTFNNKATMMHGFKGAYMSGDLVIRSRPLLEEMCNVQVTDGSIGAPESRSANGKDDRVFAAGLAHRAWVDWVRPMMIANGETWERAMAEESKPTDMSGRMGKNVRMQVIEFLRTQEQRASTPAPDWRVDLYGL